MAEQTYFTKDPDELLDFVDDWSAWLDGDTIDTATVISEDVALDVETTSHTDTAVTFWLSGGVEGTTYDVTCTIDTAAGRTAQRTSRFRIRTR